MDENWLILIAVLGSFIAGFIDAVVGGGGLLQVPLLFILFPGYHHTQIIATNRFASVAGTTVAAFQYIKRMPIHTKVILVAGSAAAISSFLGVWVMNQIPTHDFKLIIFFVILGLLIYSFKNKGLGQKDRKLNYRPKTYFIFLIIGMIIGMYNGFIGPGTGTLLVFSLVHFLQLSFLQSSAYAKLINAIADFASLISFFLQGAVLYQLAIPMLVTNMLGSWVGSTIAIKKGNQYIRYVFLIVLVVLIFRFGSDVFLKK